MPTLLELVNEVLLNVGEHPTSSFSGPTALKAKLACQLSFQFCSTLHAWKFLRTKVSTPTWVNGVAIIVPFQKLYGVYSGTNVLSPQKFIPLDQLTIRSPYVGFPRYYSIGGQNSILLYPEPSATLKPQVLFDILAHITVPVNEGDQFNYPIPFINIVRLYAEATLHRTHTTDMMSVEATTRVFEAAVHMYRSKEDAHGGSM